MQICRHDIFDGILLGPAGFVLMNLLLLYTCSELVFSQLWSLDQHHLQSQMCLGRRLKSFAVAQKDLENHS